MVAPGYYHSYDYGRPCWFYRRWDIPAPARCYRDFYGYYSSDIFLNGDFVYRDRDDFGRWRHRWQGREQRRHLYQPAAADNGIDHSSKQCCRTQNQIIRHTDRLPIRGDDNVLLTEKMYLIDFIDYY